MGYSNTGPFTNNVTPPGVSATFLNNVENFLDTVNSLATDANNTSDSNGNATVVTINVPNNGALRSKDSGGTVRQIVQLDSSNNLNIVAGGNNRISLKTSGGTEIARVNASGLSLISGTFALLTGSLARISSFSGTATTTSTNFNHNLGAVPDIIMLTLTIVSSTAHMITYDPTSLTSTQVKVQSDGTNTFAGLAIKF
jgi:hypothetical protein